LNKRTHNDQISVRERISQAYEFVAFMQLMRTIGVAEQEALRRWQARKAEQKKAVNDG